MYHSSKKQKACPRCPNCKKNTLFIKHLILVNRFNIFFCTNCDIGFTYPIPKNVANYYHSNYWLTFGVVGRMKDVIFGFFQKRRIMWINKYFQKEKILDVGSGEGNFGKCLPNKFKIVNIDSPTAKIKNPNVEKVNFLKWRTKKKFDAIVFWESLEHTISPQAYLKKASLILNDKGLIFVEYPRFNSLESQIFGKDWFHLDIPRHLSHLTDKGLSIILKRAGFVPFKHFSVSAFEYTLWGFVASILNIFKIKLTDELKKSQNLAIIFSLIPLSILACIAEVFFLIFHQSPIGLIIARRKL